jgi:hypothetical protein
MSDKDAQGSLMTPTDFETREERDVSCVAVLWSDILFDKVRERRYTTHQTMGMSDGRCDTTVRQLALEPDLDCA